MYNPRTEAGIRQELDRIPYLLAEIACGGQGLLTDRTAERLRCFLPEFTRDIVQDIDRESRRIVLVQFGSNPTTYPYQNPEGAHIGDTVAVWSGGTGQIEFPVVVDYGTGNAANVARRIP